ncbi:MAG: 6-pyruvoyl-tetrahydropterin synthase-related protein [Methylococcaceae bacterium]
MANYQLPPYWAENLYGGYGSPIFLFYAPLYMLVATIFYLVTGSIIGGSILAISFFTVVGALGVYLLVQEMLGEKTYVNQCAARIGSYFFILNPYLIGDKLIRIANSEYTALCLAPISLYGLVRIKQEPLKGSLILAAGLALGILAHNLTSLIIAAMLITLASILYWGNERKQIWLFILGGIILGLLLSAFFWLPALYYKSLTHTEQLTQGRYDFHAQFKALSKFFTNSDYFSMGLLNLWIIIQSAAILWTQRNEEKTAKITLAKTFLIFALLFIFLQTKLSLPLWENISYLALFQFPWRMMGPLALVISILAGLLLPLYYKNNNYKSLNKLELSLLILCIINILPLLVVNLPLSESMIKDLTSKFETKNIKTMILTSTEVDEYLPKSARIKLKHYANEFSPLILGETAEYGTTIIKESGTEIILETNSSNPVQLELKRWFFPDWKCSINGREQPVNISNNGLISIKIPAGQNRISLKLYPPLLRRIFTWISLSSLIVWILLAIKAYYVSRTHPVNQKQAIQGQ